MSGRSHNGAPEPDAEEFRRPGTASVLALGWGVFALIGFSSFAAKPPDVPSPWWQYGFYVPMAVVATFAAMRTLGMGLYATPASLTIRNVFRTHVVRWADIESFDRPAPYGAFRRAGLKIHLCDGRVITATLFSAGIFSKRAFADDVLARLRELHTRYAG